jgi:hypothetical protein
MKQDALNAAFDEKVRRGVFAPVARHLTNLATAEDRLQDAICQTWAMYRRYAMEKGTILPDAILVHSCRQRAVDLHRQFVPADGQRRRDVYDLRNYHDGRVTLLRIDGNCEDQTADGDRDLQVGYAEHEAANPGRKIRSAIDLERWVGELSGMDQFIMAQKYIGTSTATIAAELKLPYGQVYAKTKEKGMELANRAGVRIGGRRRRRNKGEVDAAMKAADEVLQ